MVDRVGTKHTLRNKLCFIYLILRCFLLCWVTAGLHSRSVYGGHIENRDWRNWHGVHSTLIFSVFNVVWTTAYCANLRVKWQIISIQIAAGFLPSIMKPRLRRRKRIASSFFILPSLTACVKSSWDVSKLNTVVAFSKLQLPSTFLLSCSAFLETRFVILLSESRRGCLTQTEVMPFKNK